MYRVTSFAKPMSGDSSEAAVESTSMLKINSSDIFLLSSEYLS